MRRFLFVLLALPAILVASFSFPAAAAAAPVTNCNATLLGIRPWHVYLEKEPAPDCSIKPIESWASASGRVALAIVDALIRIGTLVAVGFVIYGGIRYIVSQGSPDATKSARDTILNSVIGLVITLIATAGVAFLANLLGM